MIIINDKPGQLCNQLWANAPIIARSLKYKNKYLNLYFNDYNHFFENVNCYTLIKFNYFGNVILDVYLRKVILNLARKTPNWLLKILRISVDKKNWKSEQWDESVFGNKNKIVFTGSGFRRENRQILNEYHADIAKIFQPKAYFTSKIINLFAQQRENYDVIIGVHMRRGDYKEFLNGVYYFDDQTYLKHLKYLKEQFIKRGQNPIFLLCSNETLNLDYFDELPIFQLNKPTAIEDLYALSCCDYIIGPPSTFSMWSSYIGKVPLKFVKNSNEEIELSDFSRIVEQDKFENGDTLAHVSFEN